MLALIIALAFIGVIIAVPLAFIAAIVISVGRKNARKNALQLLASASPDVKAIERCIGVLGRMPDNESADLVRRLNDLKLRPGTLQ